MSETGLMVREDRAVVVTPEQMSLIKKTIAPSDATDAELALFIYDNTRRGVNPLDRMIHFTKRGGKYTPITGIDFMRTRASETGDYAGSDDAVFSGEVGKADFEAKVTVHRFVQGQRCPFTATARWSEYFPGEAQGHMWRKMPHTMLAKCAEALALRKGFPQQIAGLYTAEEMAQAQDVQVTVNPVSAHHVTPRQNAVITNITDSQPTPPPKVAASDDEDGGMFDDAPHEDESPADTVTITKLDSRKGEKNGKLWTQYFVTLSDGRTGSFFDGRLAVAVQAAYAAKAPVVATFETQGRFTNLVSLIAV